MTAGSAAGGSRASVSGVIFSLPAIDVMPVSTTFASGRRCLRTLDCAPSAPTSTSPVAEVPSAKNAVTVPSSLWLKCVNALSNWTTSSSPLSSAVRIAMRLTEFSARVSSRPVAMSATSSSLYFSVRMLIRVARRAVVRTNSANTSGGKQLCSALLPSGLIPTR